MRKALLFFLAFICGFSICSAQNYDFDNYTPLVSKGNLPIRLANTSTENFKQQENGIDKKENKDVSKLKKQFYLESTFSLDNLLRSGKVLFNDPVGNYVNKVYAKVKATAPEIDSSSYIYILKTNYANAFATDEGLIFVTTGLLARLKSEAQLAFILCHEAVHHIKRHSIDGFLRDNALLNSEYVRDIDLLASAAYSKEKETEADKEGFILFSKLGYKFSACKEALDVLQYSHLPFENITFDKSFFESENLYWPNSFSLLEIDTISPRKENNTLYSTHPNIDKRKADLDAISKEYENNNAQYFIVSKLEFYNVRKICRFEYAMIALKYANYCESIYSAYILLREHPKSIYLKKIIGKSLYGIATYYNFGKKEALNLDYKKLQGELQQVSVFFEHMKAYEANVLAINYLWTLKKELKNDVEVNILFDKTLNYFTLLHCNDISAFKVEEMPLDLRKTDPDNIVYNDFIIKRNAKKRNKISPYEIKLKGGKLNSKEDYVNVDSILNVDVHKRKERFPYAFNSFLSKNDFRKFFTASSKKHEELVSKIKAKDTVNKITSLNTNWGEVNPNYKEYLNTYLAEKNQKKALEKSLLKKQYSGNFNNSYKKLMGKKTIFFNPLYFSIDERKKTPVKYIASEQTRNVFITRLKKGAKAAKLPLVMLSDNEFTVTDAEKINTISLIDDWLNGYFLHEGIDILPVNYKQVSDLSDSLGSEYLCLAANVFTIRKKNDVASYVALSIILPLYSWPFTLPYLVNKKIDTRFFMLTLDMKERAVIMRETKRIKSRNREDISLSSFYSFFSQLKVLQTK